MILCIFAVLKKIMKHISFWRYSRLYRKLFFIYAQKSENADSACYNASIAFRWLTGYEYTDIF